MRYWVFLLLVGCGDDRGNKTIDAPMNPMIDAPMIDGPPVGTLDCPTYCTAIMANCTTTNSQYGSMQNCLDSCSHFAMGTLNQTSGNTLGCRLYHAGAAQAAPTTHCVHAGPGGGGMCGATLCEGFCAIGVAVCPTQAGNANQCPTRCAGYTALGTPYNSSIQSGDTQECRLYHVTAAATDPGTHCPHVAMNSATCQ